MPRIGSYTLYTVETGRFRLDGGAMFGIVPKPLWERYAPADERNRILLNMRCLLLEGNNRLILIDNGIGDKLDEKFRDIYAVDHDYAELHRSLQRLGFSAADITDVILTHLHFDHCGGSTRRVGDRLEVTFPNATFYVQRRHWEWARHPNLRERASFLPENLEPLEASGQLRLLEGPGEVLPGITVEVVNGHTEAQQIVRIDGPEGTLVFVADLIPTHVHLRPVWNMGYDIRPLVTLEEKLAFLERAEANGWHLFFEHDPEVVVVSLHRTEREIAAVHPRPLAELF
ncbi:MBL fold metallo-hydrolase [Rhodothermus profundi]|uniref:Glyoxylase, beta-lactamase superfamily II n=1 Tax=Rhodothermus profundi TaxID=633813 RepID=A0A1M6WS96_9BACT|nr:MBL fold metallo-hydrolase [Rhodothermus profundi]SHK96524.1 Glyoxylase, beta-lactamase superfamily II [Rhodothermus profundi]